MQYVSCKPMFLKDRTFQNWMVLIVLWLDNIGILRAIWKRRLKCIAGRLWRYEIKLLSLGDVFKITFIESSLPAFTTDAFVLVLWFQVKMFCLAKLFQVVLFAIMSADQIESTFMTWILSAKYDSIIFSRFCSTSWLKLLCLTCRLSVKVHCRVFINCNPVHDVCHIPNRCSNLHSMVMPVFWSVKFTSIILR